MSNENYINEYNDLSTTEMIPLLNKDPEANIYEPLKEPEVFSSNWKKLISDESNPTLFKVIKYSKFKGRKRARKIHFSQEKVISKGKHTKYSKDNILRRIKVHFFHFIIELSNDYIKKVCRKKIVKFKKAECNQIVSDVTIEFNHTMKNLPLSKILCQSGNVNVNDKKNSNKNLINLLIKDYKDFESFFSLTYLELFELFLSDKEQKIELQKIFGLKRAITMEDYIENQIKLGIDDELYGNLFRKYAKDFYYYLEPEHARKSTKIKNYKFWNIK